jgi:hypothetical protein
MFDRFGGEYSGIDEYAAARDPATGKARQPQSHSQTIAHRQSFNL